MGEGFVTEEGAADSGRVEMITIPLRYRLPDGSEALGFATVSEDVRPETLDALRGLCEAAAAGIWARTFGVIGTQGVER